MLPSHHGFTDTPSGCERQPHVPVNWSVQETYETQESAGRQFLSVLPAGG